jgi:hypothetical protein
LLHKRLSAEIFALGTNFRSAKPQAATVLSARYPLWQRFSNTGVVRNCT